MMLCCLIPSSIFLVSLSSWYAFVQFSVCGAFCVVKKQNNPLVRLSSPKVNWSQRNVSCWIMDEQRRNGRLFANCDAMLTLWSVIIGMRAVVNCGGIEYAVMSSDGLNGRECHWKVLVSRNATLCGGAVWGCSGRLLEGSRTGLNGGRVECRRDGENGSYGSSSTPL